MSTSVFLSNECSSMQAQVVKNPMFFGTIESNLNSGKYESPFEFQKDVLLSFSNCFLYNPVSDPYRKLGEKVS